MLVDVAEGVAFDFEAALRSGTVSKSKVVKRKEVCQAYQQGTCRLGDKCPERHCISAHRTVQLEVCKHWLRGGCVNGENCAYLHEYDERFVPECAFFQRLGECTNPECPFRHVNPTERTPLCAAYVRGFCPQGPLCRYRHQRSEEPCPYFLLGFCPMGPRCKMPHPYPQVYHRMALQARVHAKQLEERHNSDQAASSTTTFHRSHVCHKCGDLGHLPRSCPGVVYGNFFRATMVIQEPGETPTFFPDGRQVARICYGCGREGHESKDCPNRPPPRQFQGERR